VCGIGLRLQIFLSVQHVRLALPAATGFRLRLLSERGRLDRGHCDHRWMLKRVPVREVEGDLGLLAFGVLAGAAHTPEFRRSGLQAAIRAAAIAAWRPLLQDNSRIFVARPAGQEHRSKPGPHKPSPPETGTRFSIPSPQVRAQS